MECDDVLEALGIYFCLSIFHFMTIQKSGRQKEEQESSVYGREVGGQGV